MARSDDGLSQIDRAIVAAVAGHTEADPVDLAGIILAVDFYERIVLGAGELVGGLSRLTEAGRIEERPGHRFVEAIDRRPRPLSTVTAEDVEAAQREAVRRFGAAGHAVPAVTRRSSRNSK